MDVVFNYVGRGDSIILAWEGKIAIIDSNKISSEVPALDYLRQSSVSSIEFVLLTHPHSDHFLGLREILSFCAAAGIKIKRFYHTCSMLPEYIRASTSGPIDGRELALLFSEVDRLYTLGVIEDVGTIDIKHPYKLSDEWEMIFFSPNYGENRVMHRYVASRMANKEPYNYSVANLLSTLTMLRRPLTKEYILLTSDVERSVLKREFKENDLLRKGARLILGQIPHHAASNNHHSKFWKHIADSDTPMCASVGQGDPLHPSPEVLDDLTSFGYKVHLTAHSGNATTALLDLISVRESGGKAVIFTI